MFIKYLTIFSKYCIMFIETNKRGQTKVDGSTERESKIQGKEQYHMKQITRIRKAVCTMANELKKAGYSLSQAFKKAW